MSALACRDNNLLSLLVQDLMFMAKKLKKEWYSGWRISKKTTLQYNRRKTWTIQVFTENFKYHLPLCIPKKGSNMGPPLKTNSKETTEKLQHNFLKEH